MPFAVGAQDLTALAEIVGRLHPREEHLLFSFEGFDLASLASRFPGEIDWLLTDRKEAPIPDGTVMRVEHDCEWNNARVLEDVVPDTGFSKAVLNGYLVAYNNVLRRRSDRRGCWDGRWRLLAANGTLLAAGDWSGTVGVNSNRLPGAASLASCADPYRYEGKLDGKVYVSGPYAGAQICATLTGTGPMQPNTPQKISLSIRALHDKEQRAALRKLAAQQSASQTTTLGDLLSRKLARKAEEENQG